MPILTFIDSDGSKKKIDAPIGITVMEIAQSNGVDIEGACEGGMACSTCHVVVDETWYPKLKVAEEAEEDMLDMAFGLTKTSRLGCQIIMTDELDGLKVLLPDESRHLTFD